jgi:flagellar hook protein FlgE
MIDFSTPLAGMHQAEANLARAAGQIAKSGFPALDTVDLSEEMLSLISSKNMFAGNVKAAQTEDQMMKSLLDVTG